MTRIAFQQVDVFTAVPFRGNPVAVVLEGSTLSTLQMQDIASWTNLSETTFVCPPDDPAADYRLRIFTPRAELPFAGHPTIGSAHAVLRRGHAPKRAGRLVQECGKGLVELRLEGERILLALPAPTFHEADAGLRARAAAALGVAPEEIGAAAIIDVGPVWFTLQLPDAARVAALTGLNVFGFHRDGGPGGEPGAGPADVEVRSFAPAHGVPEDPVCGSGNGCVAALIQRERLLARAGYVASQGRCLGRDGRVEVRYDGDGRIWLGGHAVTCVEGTLSV